MHLKNLVLCTVSVAVIAFSSCKKEMIAPESQAISSDVVSSNSTADNVPETASPLTRAVVTTINSNCKGYYEILPARYSLTTKKYPLILFIHGIGELGTGVSRLTCCGIPYYANKKLFPAEFIVNGQHFSYVVVAPQFLVRPKAADIQSAIDYAVKTYRVDPKRIYISGLSMGGGSVWDYSAVYGQNVAAATPICGGTAPTSALASSIASKNLPVWTISSTNDKVVPISWAKNWVAWIKADNSSNAGNIKLTTWTAEDHNGTWTRAFNPTTKVDGYNIYEWMLRFQRTGSTVTTSTPPAPAPAPAPTPTPTPNPAPAPAPAPAGPKPVVKAGPDDTIHVFWNFSPLLNGTLSTVSGGWFTSTTWKKVSGPASCKFENAAAAKTRVSGLTAGTYVFRYSVVTNKGMTGSDDVKIIVLP